MSNALLKHFTEKELWAALKGMDPIKAPGTDGFSTLFYQHYWSIVGTDVSSFCLTVLLGKLAIEDINTTQIVLIPKVSTPKSITHFRPISLCTVLYKIISKTIVNRMSSFLECCINEAQGAFILNRLISDNTIIAYEILHIMKTRRNRNQGNFALKLDMSKAYDRMEWDFLTGMILNLGFHLDWVTLIMRCVASVLYRVGFNGYLSEKIMPSRGLR